MNETVLNILRAAKEAAENQLASAIQAVADAEDALKQAKGRKAQAEQRIADIKKVLEG